MGVEVCPVGPDPSVILAFGMGNPIATVEEVRYGRGVMARPRSAYSR
jgi:hypothetical protein